MCANKKKPICNKPRTWLVDNTVAAQSFSEWRIANNTCLKPRKKMTLDKSVCTLTVYKLCTSHTVSWETWSLTLTEEHKSLEHHGQKVSK